MLKLKSVKKRDNFLNNEHWEKMDVFLGERAREPGYLVTLVNAIHAETLNIRQAGPRKSRLAQLVKNLQYEDLRKTMPLHPCPKCGHPRPFYHRNDKNKWNDTCSSCCDDAAKQQARVSRAVGSFGGDHDAFIILLQTLKRGPRRRRDKQTKSQTTIERRESRVRISGVGDDMNSISYCRFFILAAEVGQVHVKIPFHQEERRGPLPALQGFRQPSKCYPVPYPPSPLGIRAGLRDRPSSSRLGQFTFRVQGDAASRPEA